MVYPTSCKHSANLKSSSSALQRGSASSGQSGGLGEGCGLHNVLRVASQLLLQRCSTGPLPPSGFSQEAA